MEPKRSRSRFFLGKFVKTAGFPVFFAASKFLQTPFRPFGEKEADER